MHLGKVYSGWICLTCSVGALGETSRLIQGKDKEKVKVKPQSAPPCACMEEYDKLMCSAHRQITSDLNDETSSDVSFAYLPSIKNKFSAVSAVN